MKPKSISLVDMLKQAWSLTKENLIVMWGLLFLMGVVTFVVGLLAGDSLSIRYWIFWLVQMLVTAWLNGGLYKNYLNMADGEEASFSVFKEMIPHIGNLFLLTIFTSIVLYLPLLIVAWIQSLFVSFDWAALLVSTDVESIVALPEILFNGYWSLLWLSAFLVMLYLNIRFLFALYALVDHPEEGAVVALRRSWQMTQGNVWRLVLAYLLVIVINLIGVCALVIGVFVSVVTTIFFCTVLYRQMDKEKNEPVVIADEV